MQKKLLISALVIFILLGGIIFVWQKRMSDIQPLPTPQQNKEDVQSIDTSDWKTYRNEEYGFEFSYPEEYVVLVLDSEYDGVKTLEITIKNDEQFFASLNLVGTVLGIPSEGGCWPYAGQSINLFKSVDEIKQEVQKHIQNIESVTKRQIGNNVAIQFYCIGSYANVFATKKVIIPVDWRPYTNLTISSEIMLTSDVQYDDATPQEWKQAISNLKQDIVTGQYKTNSQTKEREALFDQFIDSIKFFKNNQLL